MDVKDVLIVLQACGKANFNLSVPQMKQFNEAYERLSTTAITRAQEAASAKQKEKVEETAAVE